MNNLAKKILLKTYISPLIILITLIFSSVISAQNIDFNNGKKYTIADVAVTGETSFSPQTVIAYSGLKKGEDNCHTRRTN